MTTTAPAILPEWVLWVAALAPAGAAVITASVAVAVGVISYRQWRVAREKLVLDLFERRLAQESVFLFGGTIPARIDQLSDAAMEVSFSVANENSPPTDRALVIERYTFIAGPLGKELPELVAPYMRMTQKL